MYRNGLTSFVLLKEDFAVLSCHTAVSLSVILLLRAWITEGSKEGSGEERWGNSDVNPSSSTIQTMAAFWSQHWLSLVSRMTRSRRYIEPGLQTAPGAWRESYMTINWPRLSMTSGRGPLSLYTVCIRDGKHIDTSWSTFSSGNSSVLWIIADSANSQQSTYYANKL